MRTILLNVEKEKVEVIEVGNRLDDWYEALGCEMVEIDARRIGGRRFLVMCDEEGLLKGEPKISAISDMGDIMFVGNLMFFNDGEDGELAGLSEDDIKHLMRFIQRMSTRNFPQGYPMLTQCEWR